VWKYQVGGKKTGILVFNNFFCVLLIFFQIAAVFQFQSSIMTDKRLFEYLYDQAQHFPLERAFGAKKDDQWQYYSTAEMLALVNRTSVGLLALGLKPGDKVATVLYKTIPEWVILDFALLQIGVLNIPLYPTISAREFAYILNESEAKYCVVGVGDLYEKMALAQESAPSLLKIFSFEDHPIAPRWDAVLLAPEGADLQEVEAIKSKIHPDDLATIIYTSGTTGNPKGVMLSHRNIVFNVEAMRKLLPILPGDRGLSFLPVSHIFERAVVYAFMAYGVSTTFTGTDNLGGDDGDLKAISPHFFSTVPRLLEKVYERIMARGTELKGIKRALFFWAIEQTDDWEFDKKYTGLRAVKRKIADRLIFSKWREALGGSVNGIITGASAFPMRIMRVFNAAGIRVREGYGLTEAAPALSFSQFAPGGAMLGTVGQLLEDVEIKIDDKGEYRPGEGEIWAKGPGIMLGFYKHPEKTAEMIREDSEGRWLVTGDVGMLVTGHHGGTFLKITDRKKELLKTSGGKYVAPTPIESVFKEHRLVDQAMIIGENQKFVSALIVPSEDGLREWCHTHQIKFTNLEEMIQAPKVQERFQMLVDRVNPHFGHAEQVKKFTLLPEPWEPIKKDGTDAELTPTLKLKRRIILQKFEKEIEAMYAS
jgi:long-chain acyl-CoA synthetase